MRSSGSIVVAPPRPSVTSSFGVPGSIAGSVRSISPGPINVGSTVLPMSPSSGLLSTQTFPSTQTLPVTRNSQGRYIQSSSPNGSLASGQTSPRSGYGFMSSTSPRPPQVISTSQAAAPPFRGRRPSGGSFSIGANSVTIPATGAARPPAKSMSMGKVTHTHKAKSSAISTSTSYSTNSSLKALSATLPRNSAGSAQYLTTPTGSMREVRTVGSAGIPIVRQTSNSQVFKTSTMSLPKASSATTIRTVMAGPPKSIAAKTETMPATASNGVELEVPTVLGNGEVVLTEMLVDVGTAAEVQTIPGDACLVVEDPVLMQPVESISPVTAYVPGEIVTLVNDSPAKDPAADSGSKAQLWSELSSGLQTFKSQLDECGTHCENSGLVTADILKMQSVVADLQDRSKRSEDLACGQPSTGKLLLSYAAEGKLKLQYQAPETTKAVLHHHNHRPRESGCFAGCKLVLARHGVLGFQNSLAEVTAP